MAITGVCLINGVVPKNSTEVTIHLVCAATPDSGNQSGETDVDVDVTSLTWDEDVRAHGKTFFQNCGVSFTPVVDTVKLIGIGLL